MERWINVGFDRNEKAEVRLIWECTQCGSQFYGGMEPPRCECPECKRRKEGVSNG